jgi:prephenate dehydrogenase
MRPRVVIVGLGLVGGSLARALALKRYAVVGVDRRASTLAAARRSGAFALTTRSLERAVEGADLVVLAAPPDANLALLRRLASGARRAARPLAVTDVSSVKRRICALGASLSGVAFVGGHPMAGRERSGFAASRPGLFRGRPWILAPTSSARAQRLVRMIVRDAGARPVVLAPAEHDRAVAFLSHLPQLVAWGLRDAVRRDPVGRRRRALAGPAFADMTRIARSPRRLWRQILRENRAELARALRGFRRALVSPM